MINTEFISHLFDEFTPGHLNHREANHVGPENVPESLPAVGIELGTLDATQSFISCPF